MTRFTPRKSNVKVFQIVLKNSRGTTSLCMACVPYGPCSSNGVELTVMCSDRVVMARQETREDTRTAECSDSLFEVGQWRLYIYIELDEFIIISFLF